MKFSESPRRSFSDIQERVFQTALDKGWWDECLTGNETPSISREKVEKVIPEKIALIHSEISEALESYRNYKLLSYNEGGKPEGFPVELADAVIRIMDLCGAMGIDLEAEILKKAAYNETRSFKHGGKRC